MTNQIPVPPVGMVMPAANAVVAVLCYMLLAVFAGWALLECRRTRSWVPLFILVGGALTASIEPMLDHVGGIWYPQIGPAPVFRAFNVSLPLWAVAAYGLYVGGLSTVLYTLMARGLTRRGLWAAYFLIWAFNLGLELPGLMLGIYAYYGDPAFNVLGFPMCWAMTNVTIPVLVGAVLTSHRALLVGWRALLVLPLVPMLGAAGEAASGFPSWISLNSGVGAGVKLVAACLTLCFSLLITYLVSLTVCTADGPVRVTMPAAGDEGLASAALAGGGV